MHFIFIASLTAIYYYLLKNRNKYHWVLSPVKNPNEKLPANDDKSKKVFPVFYTIDGFS